MALIARFVQHLRLPLMVLVCLTVLVAFSIPVLMYRPRLVDFKTPRDFADFAQQHGLFIHSGCGRSAIDSICIASDHPLDFDQIAQLNMQRCGLTPAWKGVVLVGYLDQEDGKVFGALTPEGIDGYFRIWGNVLAAGDPALLDHLEDTYRASWCGVADGPCQRRLGTTRAAGS
jgi:hypothetical protein